MTPNELLEAQAIALQVILRQEQDFWDFYDSLLPDQRDAFQLAHDPYYRRLPR